MADEDQEPVVEEPVVVPDVAVVEEPRRTNKAVIGLSIGLVILCAIIVYSCFSIRRRVCAITTTTTDPSYQMLNSRTISDNGGYGGSFNNNSARNFRV